MFAANAELAVSFQSVSHVLFEELWLSSLTQLLSLCFPIWQTRKQQRPRRQTVPRCQTRLQYRRWGGVWHGYAKKRSNQKWRRTSHNLNVLTCVYCCLFRRDWQLVHVRRRQEGDRQRPDLDQQTRREASHSMQRGERDRSHVSQVSRGGYAGFVSLKFPGRCRRICNHQHRSPCASSPPATCWSPPPTCTACGRSPPGEALPISSPDRRWTRWSRSRQRRSTRSW